MSLGWLQVRINHRILGLNYYLYKMKLVESDKSTFCNQVSETIQHIIWECEQVKYFWNGFDIMLYDNRELVYLRFCKNSIIFGNHNFDKILNE